MSYSAAPTPPPPPPASTVRPIPDGLGLATLIIGGFLALYLVVSFTLSFEAASVYSESARNGIDVMHTPLVAWDLVQIGSLVIFPLYIVGCLFLHRARNVADALGAPQARGKVWVWLGWWVPIVSFWFPYQVVRDLVRAAQRTVEPNISLGGWWAAWLTSMVAAGIASRAIPWQGVPDEGLVSALPIFEGVAAAGAVVAFMFWVRIVRAIETGFASQA